MKRRDPRRPESGTITVLATFLLVALFALSALAVDVGFLYTRSRMMYAVADGAVAAAMGDFTAGNTTAATTDVNNLAAQYGGAYSFSLTPPPTATQLSVRVTATYPLYFAKIFGLSSKQLIVTAAGKKGIPTPALLALSNACSGGVGLTINGSGGMTVHGDVDSNGKLDFETGTPGGAHILGGALTPCAGGPLTHGTAGQSTYDTATGTYGNGGPFTDPFAPYAIPTCNYGTTSSGGDPTVGHWNFETAVRNKLDPGVYCTTSNLTISGGGAQAVDATGCTFIVIGGTIQIGLNYTSMFSAAANSPNGVIAYTTYSGLCSSGPAINLGGPAATAAETLTMTGSLYAPNGCINAGANNATTIVGSFIGEEVEVGDYGAWDIGTSGGGGGTSWQMVQ